MQPLNTYWDNHLRVAFEQSAAHDLPAIVEASMAHVIMLTEQGSMAKERGVALLKGLLSLWDYWGAGLQTPAFDGSVEDPYYYFEQQLAATLSVPTDDLDVQLARSRNDLDAGIFRMILRSMTLMHGSLIGDLVDALLESACESRKAIIIGMTHRRPAQPTSIAHVLNGLCDAWLGCLVDVQQTFDELNVSPLGGAAFAGTDIKYNASRVAELLGFASVYNNSYQAIAGAGHFIKTAGVHNRIASLSARWARVLQEWMGLGWVATPLGFTQGSSIMPQKVNPVVCEHLVSMAGATFGDTQAVVTNIGQSWYEDSNNATTDVQQHLWRSSERLNRVLRLQIGLASALKIQNLPTSGEIIASGATTTAVAEALSVLGVPWRQAHSAVKSLVRDSFPSEWTLESVAACLRAADVDPSYAQRIIAVANQPELVLSRRQPGSPGIHPIEASLKHNREKLEQSIAALNERQTALINARSNLFKTAKQLAGTSSCLKRADGA